MTELRERVMERARKSRHLDGIDAKVEVIVNDMQVHPTGRFLLPDGTVIEDQELARMIAPWELNIECPICGALWASEDPDYWEEETCNCSGVAVMDLDEFVVNGDIMREIVAKKLMDFAEKETGKRPVRFKLPKYQVPTVAAFIFGDGEEVELPLPIELQYETFGAFY